MSDVLKVIELLAESDESWEAAAREAVSRANQTLEGVRSVFIKNFEAKVEDGKITSYRVNAKVSFVLS